jgi:Condensation domain
MIPLSYEQRRLWFMNRLEGGSATYNMPIPLRLRGVLDVPALRAALGDVVARHEALRTVFPEREGDPFQQVMDGGPDLVVRQVGEAGLEKALSECGSAGFDLTEELPFRASLFALAPEDHVLLLVLHHISGDGWSMVPLARDVMRAYEARRDGRAPDWDPLPVQYADYALWQQELLGDEDDPDSLISTQIRFWEQALAGLPDQLEMPIDRPRPVQATYQGGRVRLDVEPALRQRLAELARECQASVFMAVQAALAVLCMRLGAGTDIPIGSPIAGRADEALEDLVGMFVNTLVLRSDLSGDPSFRELLARTREADLAAYQHQDLPFERLVEVVNPVRSLSRHPLFQVMLEFQNNEVAVVDLPGLNAEFLPLDVGIAKFDLTFHLGEDPDGGFSGALEYATDLFDEHTAQQLAERYVRVLEAVVADPDAPVGGVDILVSGERRQLLT